ncbi:MAG: adenylate/guanylate cyclase domain-containing protein [Hyphomicrobium sp.]
MRPLLAGGYCLSGPMSTPHVHVQMLLAPGERREVTVDLPAGLYRLRTLHPGHGRGRRSQGRRLSRPARNARGRRGAAGGDGRHDRLRERRRLRSSRPDRGPILDARCAHRARGDHAAGLPRPVRRGDVAVPGDEAAVGQVALLFSDLRGSTALYERVGDAAAYNIVRDHFAFLAAIVRSHDGAVVKTIGRRGNGPAFGDPAEAVKAALAIQADIATFNATREKALVVKLGVHTGGSVIVNLNERLDYFGSTVNMAARPAGPERGRRHRAEPRRG